MIKATMILSVPFPWTFPFFDNLDEVDQLLENYKLPILTVYEIGILNRCVAIKPE